jgi:hypothetical protein
VIGFEVPFATQVANVWKGRTADGTRAHALSPLPDMDRFTDLRQKILETSAWTLYGLKDDLRAREDVRTFVIWSTAAHLWRLTRNGSMLATAVRDVEWMSRLMTDQVSFTATTAFARKLMPDLVLATQPQFREAARKEALDVTRIKTSALRASDGMPVRVVYDSRYTIYAHFTPEHILANPYLATRWITHVEALATGTETDHEYWRQVAHGERKVFSFFLTRTCKATFDSHLGHLKTLMVFDPADEIVYDRLSFALAHLGDMFKFPKDSSNPAIQTLLATQARHMRELKKSIAYARHNASEKDAPAAPGWPSHTTTPSKAIDVRSSGLASARALLRNTARVLRYFGCPSQTKHSPTRGATRSRTTDTFLAYIVLAAAISYLIPLSIVAAPNFARTYVHLWRVALGMEPECAAWTDCAERLPHPSSSAIPPHRGGKP